MLGACTSTEPTNNSAPSDSAVKTMAGADLVKQNSAKEKDKVLIIDVLKQIKTSFLKTKQLHCIAIQELKVLKLHKS